MGGGTDSTNQKKSNTRKYLHYTGLQILDPGGGQMTSASCPNVEALQIFQQNQTWTRQRFAFRYKK